MKAMFCLVWSVAFFALTDAAIPRVPACFQASEVTNGLGFPTDFCTLEDGTVLVLDKSGRVKTLFGQTVLDITSQVTNAGELGLLSCAVQPSTPYVYFAYSNSDIASPAAHVISRFTWNGQSFSRSSEQIIFGSCRTKSDCLKISPGHPFHTGGGLIFKDDTLYFSKGDGQLYEDGPQTWIGPQELTDYNGKIMRIGLDGKGLASNPFYDGNPDSIRSRIFATGFRNPWTFSLIPKSENLAVMDVGWYNQESIKEMAPGANGGWPCYEGTFQPHQNTYACAGIGTRYRPWNALQVISHWDGHGSAVIGGSFFTGFPAPWDQTLLVADFVQGRLVAIHRTGQFQATSTPFGSASGVSKIKQATNGNIWLLQMDNGGSIREISYTCPKGKPNTSLKSTTTASKAIIAQVTTTSSYINPTCTQSNSKILPLQPGWSRVMDATEAGVSACIKQRGYPAGCFTNANPVGLPFTVANRRYSKGWSVVLPGGVGRLAPNISLNLNGRCSKLETVVGIEGLVNSLQAKLGRVEYLFWGDGKLIFNSTTFLKKPLHWNTPLFSQVNLIGVKRLIMQVRRPTIQPSPQFTQQQINQASLVNITADWLDPILYCGPDSPFAPTVKINGRWTVNGKPAWNLIVKNNDNVTVSALLVKDWQGNPVPVDNYRWYINLEHCVGTRCHAHGNMYSVTGSSQITWQVLPHDSDCVYWQVMLVVTDSCGRSNVATQEVRVAGSQDRKCLGL